MGMRLPADLIRHALCRMVTIIQSTRAQARVLMAATLIMTSKQAEMTAVMAHCVLTLPITWTPTIRRTSLVLRGSFQWTTAVLLASHASPSVVLVVASYKPESDLHT